MKIIEKIVKKSDGYYVQSEKGKNLGGPYKDKESAEKRLGQVEFFKNKDKRKVDESGEGLLSGKRVEIPANAKPIYTDTRMGYEAPMKFYRIDGVVYDSLGFKVDDEELKELELTNESLNEYLNITGNEDFTVKDVDIEYTGGGIWVAYGVYDNGLGFSLGSDLLFVYDEDARNEWDAEDEYEWEQAHIVWEDSGDGLNKESNLFKSTLKQVFGLECERVNKTAEEPIAVLDYYDLFSENKDILKPKFTEAKIKATGNMVEVPIDEPAKWVSNISENDRTFDIYRVIKNGRGMWKAVDTENGEEFEITYKQGIGEEPIVSKSLGKVLGRKLNTKRESVDKKIKKSLYIYQFPHLSRRDIKAAKSYGLEDITSSYESIDDDTFLIGNLEDIESFGDKYLGGYQLVNGYLFDDEDNLVTLGEHLTESKFLLKEEAKEIWASDQTKDYYYTASIEDLKSELDDQQVDYDGWGEDEIRGYFLEDDIHSEVNYEDFEYNILPAIDKQCYADVLVLFGDSANWSDVRQATKVLHRANDLLNYVYPEFETTTQISEDGTGVYYTQSSHDTPMDRTKIYLYSLKSEEDLDKLTEWCSESDWFNPDYDYCVEFLEDQTDYKDIEDLINKGILTPIKDIR